MGASTVNLKKEFPSVLDSAYAQYKRNLSRYKEAKEIMTRDIITTTPEASMDAVARTMGQEHIGSLIVTKYGAHVGIVTERDLLTKVLASGKDPAEEKVEDAMSYPLVKISVAAKIKETAQMMIHKKGRLAVFDAGDLVGIITASDLIRSLPEVPETAVKVEDFMSQPVVTANEKTPVIDVAKIMGKERIGSVIISRDGAPFGIFTERDLLTEFLAKDKTLHSEVGTAASTPIITVLEGTSVHVAAAAMSMKHIRRLPVEAADRIVGVITARDLVEAYAK
ncbi:MAG: CBS domain-containing protein [Candidatus Bathyarchaeota archaeon]|nr:CBS domain-containing protein [Candidatus Bathyarchaeota archaeon]